MRGFLLGFICAIALTAFWHESPKRKPQPFRTYKRFTEPMAKPKESTVTNNITVYQPPVQTFSEPGLYEVNADLPLDIQVEQAWRQMLGDVPSHVKEYQRKWNDLLNNPPKKASVFDNYVNR